MNCSRHFQAGGRAADPQLRIVSLQEVFDALERELEPLAEEKGIELGFVARASRLQ